MGVLFGSFFLIAVISIFICVFECAEEKKNIRESDERYRELMLNQRRREMFERLQDEIKEDL